MPPLTKILAVPLFFLIPVVLPAQQPVQIQVYLNRPDGRLKPVWANVGHDEPNYTYSPDGRALLRQLARLCACTVHDRTHNLLTTGDGTPALKWGSTDADAVNAAGRAVYNWKILDRIFDAYKTAGVVPYVEIGFMPKALSAHPEPYHSLWPKGPLFTGWAYPPKSYRRWSKLVTHWVRHEVLRYGRQSVEKWDWEVWNEPDIGYWHGSEKQYEKLYDFTAAAVKRALPQARVGGPATTGPASPHAARFLRDFLNHCVNGKNYATGKTGSPLDFISFHAKGRTQFTHGQARMGLRQNLEDIAHGFKIVASFPRLRHLPIMISESDPDPCAACSASLYPKNDYRNGSQYASYEAELLFNTLALAARDRVNLQGYVSWAFTFPGHPYFYGYRSLATHGIVKPVLDAFRMFGMLGRRRAQAVSSGQRSLRQLLRKHAVMRPDVGVLATRGRNSASILVWNYDDRSVPTTAARVVMTITGLPANTRRVLAMQFRIDHDHSNAYTAWKVMGSPQSPTPKQIAALKKAGQLQLMSSPQWLKAHGGKLRLNFTLPQPGLSLFRLHWQENTK